MSEILKVYWILSLKAKHESKTYNVSDEKLCKIWKESIRTWTAQMKHFELPYFSNLTKILAFYNFMPDLFKISDIWYMLFQNHMTFRKIRYKYIRFLKKFDKNPPKYPFLWRSRIIVSDFQKVGKNTTNL